MIGMLQQLVSLLISVYIWIIIVGAIASWLVAFNIVNPNQPAVSALLDLLWRVTDPALRPIRSVVPTMGGLDISPMILIVGLIILQGLIT